jgi:hypothetical protein
MFRSILVAAACILLTAGLTSAWWVKGHESITEAAAGGLPDEMPAFFRAEGKKLAHYAGDPDRWKNPAAKHLRAAEAPDHHIDLEDFADKELPADRWQAITLLISLKQKPEKTGFLPYAIMENYDRLSCAFYDLRKNPDDPAIRAKCLVYAGVLAHLTGDATMPLHSTRNYDGKPGTDGKTIQKGIHARIDSFPEKHGLTAEEMGRDLKPNVIDNVWENVVRTIRSSHEEVERCYDLDKENAFEKPTEASRKFILGRCRLAAQFTMDLWYTAWVRSAKMPPPY